MATILLLETATDVCAVGIAVNGRLAATATEPPPAAHAAHLTILIRQCLEQTGLNPADLDAVAVSAGPGSYTGLRVGASVAKGICYALNKPLIAVNTLDALAQGMWEAQPEPRDAYCFMPMLDARRQEVWTAVYDHQLQRLIPPQPLILENNLFSFFEAQTGRAVMPKKLVLGGNGSFKTAGGAYLPEAVVSPVVQCAAAFLLTAAETKFKSSDFEDIVYFEPFYMKPPNITVSKKI
jgi:tRNA threonylcarbamoyladenosine biosynthesis protein TsaB